MARTNRVRQLTSAQLSQEVRDLAVAALLGDEINDAALARWGRLVRELARRDYRFRAHGRRCTCSDCYDLLATWSDLQRRVGADVTAYVPTPE